MNERFELAKTMTFYTHEPEDAIRIVEGGVYIFIVPWSEESGKAGKRVPFCEMDADHFIPSFDRNSSGVNAASVMQASTTRNFMVAPKWPV